MRVLRFGERQRVVLDRILGLSALGALSSAAASIFGRMCDPHITVAGAPPFGSNAIYGTPVNVLAMFVMAIAAAAVARQLPRVWWILVRFRTVIFIVALIAAVVLPALRYPHHILGACIS